MTASRKVLLCVGVAYIALAITSLLAGTNLLTPPYALQILLTLSGPCAFLLWGPQAFFWFLAGTVVFFGAAIMATRTLTIHVAWLAVACLLWIGSALLSFAFSV